MSRKDDCWENAVVKSFFATPEVGADPLAQLPDQRGSTSRHRRVHHDFYNSRRLHSYL